MLAHVVAICCGYHLLDAAPDGSAATYAGDPSHQPDASSLCTNECAFTFRGVGSGAVRNGVLTSYNHVTNCADR